MKHPHEDEIRRLVENWAAWTGDAKGAVYATSPIAWTEEAYTRREVSRSQLYVIKPIGAEAQLTGEALAAMAPREARALKAWCLSSLTADMAAREYLHCSRRTYDLLVSRALDAFWNAYQARISRAADHRAAMAGSGGYR